MNTNTLRQLSLAGVAGGVCWIVMAVSALLSEARPDGQKVVLETAGDYAGFGIFAAALALTVCALLALHGHHRGADGALGRTGVRIAAAGCAAQCLVISTIVVTGEEPSFFGVAAPLAILTWFVGSVAFGVAIRRAGVLPSWVGVALPVVTAVAIVGSEGGTSVLIGVFLIVVGARLATAAGAGAQPPLRTAARKA